MASTYTSFANLEKFEDRSIGWDQATNLDTIDQGINLHVLTNGSGADVAAFTPVRLHASTASAFNTVTLSTGAPAFGLTLAAIATGATGQVLTRGYVQNSGWAWTVGDVLYLTTAGTIATRAGLTHCASSGDLLYFQPVGIATSTTRAWFDFAPFNIQPYTLTADGAYVSSGSATPTFKAVTGPGNAFVYTATTAVVVYTFTLPGWFRAIPNVTGVWGFRIKYKATAGGSLDVSTVYDGQNHSGDPGVTAGTSTSWTTLDCSWAQMNAISGWAPASGGAIHVAVTAATQPIDFEVAPRLRFEPYPTIFG